MDSIKIILTGATGMVGEGVLLECLRNPKVSAVLMVNRKHFDFTHPKLKELLVPDFLQMDQLGEQLKGYDACFYCAGISSIGMNEETYRKITYDTTLHFAKTVQLLNPAMVFTFVSGRSTDSTEKGKMMWARVKGKTENDLMKLPFKGQFNFRPGVMKPFKEQKNVKPILRFLSLIFSALLPGSSLTMHQVGVAMIHSVVRGYPKQILEIPDIKELAK